MIKIDVSMEKADKFNIIGNISLKDNTVILVEHGLLNFNILETKVENGEMKFRISTVSSKAEFDDMKFISLDKLFNKIISVNFGILDVKGLNPTNDLSSVIHDNAKIINKMCSVTYPKGMLEKLEKAGVTAIRKSFYEALGRVISEKYAVYDSGHSKKIREYNKEALLSFINSRPFLYAKKISRRMNINDIFTFLINPLIDLQYMVGEKEKRYVHSVFNVITNIANNSTEYNIMTLRNLVYRYANENINIILPLILTVNALEMFMYDSQSNNVSKEDEVYFLNAVNSYIRSKTTLSNTNFAESVFYKFDENNPMIGQSIGNYTTTLINNEKMEAPINMENTSVDNKVITDDRLKSSLYKDIALSLAGVKNKIEDMETEDDRKELVKEVDSLANKILDARLRLANLSSNLVEFDNLDEEVKDTKFDITNFNIYSKDAISVKESFGIVPVNDYFSFGEINPYNINNPTNIKDPLKKVAKRAYVHTENIVVTAVKFIFGVLRRDVDQLGADLFYGVRKVADIFNGVFGKIRLLFGASFPVTSYGAFNLSDVKRVIGQKVFDSSAKRNKRYKEWNEAKFKVKNKIMSTLTDLTYNEDFAIPLEEEYKFVEVPIEIDITAKGEADLIKDVMSKKVKMSTGIKRLLLAKTMKAVNNRLKNKKVDKAMKDRLEAENTTYKEAMKKALKEKKITKKEYDWFIENALYDTKSIKVAESKN